MKTIAVFSVKGGVGKSALAVNLAYAAATQSARRTLLWDLDAQGAATFTLRLEAKPGAAARKLFADDAGLGAMIQASAYPRLDVLAADPSLQQLERQITATDKAKRLKKILKALASDYDRIVIDCPPGLTELAEQVFRAVDLIVVPMLPSPLSVRAGEQLTHHLAQHHRGGPAVIPVFTMVDRRKVLHKSIVDDLPGQLTIPYASAVEQMAVHRAPVGATAPSSVAARAFTTLWTAVERQLLQSAGDRQVS